MNKPVVLLVDDQIKMANIVKRILQHAGYEVVYAQNGVEALEMLKQKIPNIVLCDVNMPEMDGYQFLKLFRESTADKTVPFLFLTANDSYSSIREGMNLGADDYLCKPVKRKELLDAITARLNKKVALQQSIDTLTTNYIDEIAEKDNSLDEIGWNVSHVLRAPIANMMAIVSLMDAESMSEKNAKLLELLKPLPYKLDTAIRENVLKINSITTKK